MAIRLIADGKLKLETLCTSYPYTEVLNAFQDAIGCTVLKPIIIMDKTLGKK